MNIDYGNYRLESKTVSYEGETDDGKCFTITANWNDWDDWTVDEVTWHDEDGGSEEEVEAITVQFLSDMN